MSKPRTRALDGTALRLAAEDLPTETIVEGSPSVSALELWTASGPVAVGVWELSRGCVRDVEGDETFVVLAGRATVEVSGGPTLELRAGTVGTLRAGDRTVWRVSETLRKVYVLHGPHEGPGPDG